MPVINARFRLDSMPAEISPLFLRHSRPKEMQHSVRSQSSLVVPSAVRKRFHVRRPGSQLSVLSVSLLPLPLPLPSSSSASTS